MQFFDQFFLFSVFPHSGGTDFIWKLLWWGWVNDEFKFLLNYSLLFIRVFYSENNSRAQNPCNWTELDSSGRRESLSLVAAHLASNHHIFVYFSCPLVLLNLRLWLFPQQLLAITIDWDPPSADFLLIINLLLFMCLFDNYLKTLLYQGPEVHYAPRPVLWLF